MAKRPSDPPIPRPPLVEPFDETLRLIDEALSEELPLTDVLAMLDDDQARPIDEDEVTPRVTRRPPSQ